MMVGIFTRWLPDAPLRSSVFRLALDIGDDIHAVQSVADPIVSTSCLTIPVWPSVLIRLQYGA